MVTNFFPFITLVDLEVDLTTLFPEPEPLEPAEKDEKDVNEGPKLFMFGNPKNDCIIFELISPGFPRWGRF